MAYPDLSDLRTRVRTLVNEDSASTFLTDTILNRFLNDGERHIAIITGCLENIDTAATVAATRLVQFSGHKIKNLEYIPASGNRVGLQKVTLKHLGRHIDTATVPKYWTQWGNSAVIDPLPATAYNLYLYVSDYPHTEMSGDTDEPAIPAVYHEDIVQYAVFRFHLRSGKHQQAAAVYNKYIDSIQTKKISIIAQQPDSRNVIKIPDVVGKGDQG